MTKLNLKDMNLKELNVKDLDVKKFLELGNRYAAQSDWKDFAMVKFCLCAMGTLIGVLVPKKAKKKAVVVSGILFLGTYIPLMKKVFEIAQEMDEEEDFEDELFDEEMIFEEDESEE